MNQNEAIKALDSVTRAHVEREIKFLLIPYFFFRAYVRFTGANKKKSHFYGNEHQVTYNQLLHGKVPYIELNKAKGYLDLVSMIEDRIKGKYLSAKIYMKSSPEVKDFDVLCREYFKGGLTVHYEPVLSADEVRLLYYSIKGGRVVLEETDPNAIDFKAELENQLK